MNLRRSVLGGTRILQPVLALIFFMGPAVAEAQVTPGTVFVSATFEVLSVRAQFSGDPQGHATASILYRKSSGDTGWHNAYTPFIDRRATIGGVTNPYANEARASIVGLVPATSYDVQVIWSDPDGISGSQRGIVTVATLSYTPPTGGSTITVTNDATLASALTSVAPGQTIHLNAGIYSPFVVTTSGTSSAWIRIEGDPGGGTVVTGVGVNQNILVSANYLVIHQLTLGPSDSSGIVLSSGQHHVFIQDNTLQNISTQCAADPNGHYGDGGITVGSNANNVYLLRNAISSAALSVAACTLSPIWDSPGAGIQWTNATTLVVKGNTVTGGFRDAITSDASSDAGVDVDLTNNTVNGYKDDGVESKGGNLNVRLWGNTITVDAGDTCVAANTNTTTNLYGPLYIFRNTCRVTTSNSAGATTYKLYPVVPLFLFHNSIDSSPAAVHFDTYVVAGGPVTVLNNIAKSSGSMIDFAPSPSVFNYDLGLVTTGASYTYQWNGTTTYDTFADFQAGAGQESHGLNTDPLFLDTALHIAANSPAVDAGLILPNFNSLDSAWPYSGSAPDIGAFELSSASSIAPPLAPTNPRVR